MDALGSLEHSPLGQLCVKGADPEENGVTSALPLRAEPHTSLGWGRADASRKGKKVVCGQNHNAKYILSVSGQCRGKGWAETFLPGPGRKAVVAETPACLG